MTVLAPLLVLGCVNSGTDMVTAPEPIPPFTIAIKRVAVAIAAVLGLSSPVVGGPIEWPTPWELCVTVPQSTFGTQSLVVVAPGCAGGAAVALALAPIGLTAGVVFVPNALVTREGSADPIITFLWISSYAGIALGSTAVGLPFLLGKEALWDGPRALLGTPTREDRIRMEAGVVAHRSVFLWQGTEPPRTDCEQVGALAIPDPRGLVEGDAAAWNALADAAAESGATDLVLPPGTLSDAVLSDAEVTANAYRCAR